MVYGFPHAHILYQKKWFDARIEIERLLWNVAVKDWNDIEVAGEIVQDRLNGLEE